jgi:hypothetical protein
MADGCGSGLTSLAQLLTSNATAVGGNVIMISISANLPRCRVRGTGMAEEASHETNLDDGGATRCDSTTHV